MDSRISAAVSAGSISATDQTALDSALDAIDSSLASQRTGGSRPSGDIKSRIDDLIDQQVSAGTLSEDQASELRSFFAEGPGEARETAQAQDAEGMEGMRGVGGPPPGPPPSDSESSDDEDSSDTLAEQTTQQIEALMTFLEQLRDSLSSGLYAGSTSSTASSGSTNAGLVIDTSA
jgi:hypothetical protein